MTLAESLSFINKENYFLMSLIIGFVIDIIPAIGILGPIAGGFIYSYFSIYFGDIPRDQMEALKRGGIMGLIISIIGLVISAFTWSTMVPVMPTAYSSLVFLNMVIVGLILGAILGAIGGFVSLYIE